MVEIQHKVRETMMNQRTTFTCFALVVLFSVPSWGADLQRMQLLMGTTATVRVWGPDSISCERAIDAAFEEMAQIDQIMSTYKADSQISELNRKNTLSWMDIDYRFYDVLKSAKRYGDLSEGAFDVTVLPLMHLWGFRGDNPSIPADKELEATLGRVGHHHWQLHPEENQLKFSSPDVQFDLGGIAKGYALDRAALALQTHEVGGGILDLGGNLLFFGLGPKSVLGIRDPLYSDRLLGTLEVSHGGVATSGTYEKNIVIDGKRYSHILDPRTGRPAESLLSVTVVALSATAADALATAVYVLGPERGIELLKSLPLTEGILVWGGGDQGLQVLVSEGLKSVFQRGSGYPSSK